MKHNYTYVAGLDCDVDSRKISLVICELRLKSSEEPASTEKANSKGNNRIDFLHLITLSGDIKQELQKLGEAKEDSNGILFIVNATGGAFEYFDLMLTAGFDVIGINVNSGTKVKYREDKVYKLYDVGKLKLAGILSNTFKENRMHKNADLELNEEEDLHLQNFKALANNVNLLRVGKANVVSSLSLVAFYSDYILQSTF